MTTKDNALRNEQFDIDQPFVTQEEKFKYWQESKAHIKALEAALSDAVTLPDGWVSDPDTIPAQLIEVTRQAIRIEFGDDGTDGYYKRILAKIFKAMLQAAPTYEKEKG
jgi:hypothetical protein